MRLELLNFGIIGVGVRDMIVKLVGDLFGVKVDCEFYWVNWGFFFNLLVCLLVFRIVVGYVVFLVGKGKFVDVFCEEVGDCYLFSCYVEFDVLMRELFIVELMDKVFMVWLVMGFFELLFDVCCDFVGKDGIFIGLLVKGDVYFVK